MANTADCFLPRVTVKRLGTSAPVGDTAGNFPNEDGFVRVFDQIRLSAQQTFGSLALGNVASDFRCSNDNARGITYRRDRERNFDRATVFGYTHRIVVLDSFAGGEPLQNCVFLVLPVGRNQAT